MKTIKDYSNLENLNEKEQEKEDTHEKSINTSKSNASITYNDNNLQDTYDQKSFHNKDKLI